MIRRRAAAWGVVLALAALSSPVAGAPPVTVRFHGEAKAQWDVEPAMRSVSVARGEVFDTQVRVRNRSAREVVAMVVKQIRPEEAEGNLIHLGCGTTFTLVLKPGEAVAVPVSYLVAESRAPPADAFDISYTVYSFEPYSPDPLRLGQRLYQERCVSCHGLQGRGDGPTGRRLAGGVSDLAAALRGKEEQRLLEAIASGVGPMPAFSPALNITEQRALVVYLRSLAQGTQ